MMVYYLWLGHYGLVW